MKGELFYTGITAVERDLPEFLAAIDRCVHDLQSHLNSDQCVLVGGFRISFRRGEIVLSYTRTLTPTEQAEADKRRDGQLALKKRKLEKLKKEIEAMEAKK